LVHVITTGEVPTTPDFRAREHDIPDDWNYTHDRAGS
jgi:hypothetical protein